MENNELHPLPSTWPEILSDFSVGETRFFPATNPAALLSCRIAISRRGKIHPEESFSTKALDGLFSVTREE